MKIIFFCLKILNILGVTKQNLMKKLLTLLLLCVALYSCKKKDKTNPEEDDDRITFDVQCTGCSVTYTDPDGVERTKNDVQNFVRIDYPKARNITINVTYNSFFNFIFKVNGLTVLTRPYNKSAIFIYEYKDRTLYDGSAKYQFSNPSSGPSNGGSSGCGSHNGKPLHIGSKGGCYYINSNGNKTYVDRSECKC